MRRRPRLLAAVALIVGGGVAAACSDDPSGPAGNGHPAPPVEAAASSPTAVTVQWTAPEDGGRWWVILAAPDGRSVGQRTACGECRALTVEHLAPSSAYDVRVVAVDAHGIFGDFGDPVQVTTPAAPGCEAVDEGEVCARVDATAVLGDATGVGLGGLHGITAGTAANAVATLEPRAWRVSALDVERFRLARGYGATVTVLLSDAWIAEAELRAPWTDWEGYEAFVGRVVDAHIAANLLPDYWEVQNEPSVDAYEGGETATTSLVLEQHERAAAVIHARLPDAAVIGPSAAYVTFGSGVADIEAFAARAAGPDRPLSALSWHEIGAGCLGDCDGSPRAVLQHADDVRAAIAATSDAQQVQLHVNEWGAPWSFSQPGAVVGYLSSLATAGIDVANPACWPVTDASGETESSCSATPGTLDGLLLSDGQTLTDAWFAHLAYARMTGTGFRLLTTTVADPEASILATVDEAGVIRVLLGRHTGCGSGVDQSCPDGVDYAPDETVSLVVGAEDSSPAYVAVVERIRSVAGASTGPEPVATVTVEPEGGVLAVGSWSVADGDAILVTMAPTG